MSSKKTEKFKLHVPKEKEPDRNMPAKLEVVDYNPARTSKASMGGGAYNPYERPIGTGDTARMRKPRVDLRKLSEWIKTTNQVKAQRNENPDPEKKPDND
ncbi:MAG: hypothetical protein ABI645_10830 [Pseudomonadota bacterium]